MAIEQVSGRVPPAVALRQLIAERRRSAMVLAAGLGPVLEVVDSYIVALELRITQLEAAAAKRGEG